MMHRLMIRALAAVALMTFSSLSIAQTTVPTTGGDVIFSTSFEPGKAEEGWGKLKPGADIVLGYGEAHGGEQYVEIKGRNVNTQYSLATRPIPVTVGDSYVLSFAYRFTPKVGRYGLMGVLFCYDAHGELVKTKMSGWRTDGKHPFFAVDGPGSGKWEVAHQKFTVPEKVASIRIYMRSIYLPKGQKAFVDDLKLTTAVPAVAAVYEIDSHKAVLHGRIQLTPSSLKADAVQILVRDYDPKANARPVMDPKTGKYNTDFDIQSYGPIRKQLELPAGKEEFSIDLSDLPDRAYSLSVSARLPDGKTLYSRDTVKSAVFYEMRHPDWAGNELGYLGKNDAPPSPWTPLEYDAATQTVTTWNNRLQFSDDLALRKMDFLRSGQSGLINGGERLLLGGRPMNGRFTFEKPKLVERTPHSVTLATRGDDGKIALTVQAKVEFDGFVEYTLQVKARRDVRLDSLAAAFPLRPEMLRFLHPYGSGWQGNRTILDSKKPQWKTEDWRASLWLGNEQIGVNFCIGSNRPGYAVDPNSAKLPAELRDGQWQLTLLPPVSLKAEQSLKLRYGVQPTPTRPRLKNFRDIVMRGKIHSDLELQWANPKHFRYFGFPIQQDHAMTTWAERVKSMPGSPWAIFYASTGYYMTTLPPATWFADRWSVPEADTAYKGTSLYTGWGGQWTGDFAPVHVDDPLWQDYFCHHLDRLLSTTQLDGPYFDVSGVTYGDVLSARELQKRIYVIVKRHRPNGIVMFHSAINSAAPYAGFADILWRGEEYRGGLSQHRYYLDFLTLEQFRCNVTTEGAGVLFLPQYRQKDKAGDPLLASQLMGLILLHDMNLRPEPYMDMQVGENVVAFERSFGPRAGAAFYPYWKKQPGWIGVSSDQVVHSTYDREGDLFVVLFNKSRQPVRTTLRIDANALKDGRKAILFDPATNKSLNYSASEAQSGVPLELAPFDCRLLQVK